MTRADTADARTDVPGPPHPSAATSTPASPAPVAGKRARILSGEAEATPAAPYVGRRVARPAEPVPSPRLDTGTIDTGTIARVLADLEPVDHSTSFAGDETAVLPLVTAAPPAQPGRRRASRAERPTAHPLVRRLPSVPLAAGLAVLGIAVVGTVGTAATDLADTTVRPQQIGALTQGGSSGSSAVRGPVVSRSADRGDALASAVAGRNARIATVDKQAAARAADLAANRWVLPVSPSAYHLTARFGDVGLWATVHTGLDFAANPGTPIMAVAAGTVTSTGYDGAYGNRTVITLADGTEIWFCHQTSILVSVGQQVTPGQQIGTVGSTGHVTGPHLHLEVRPGGGDPVDPYAALVAHGVTP